MKTGSTYKEPLGGQMGKIMGKQKHNYNVSKELRNKVFSQTMRHLVNSTKFR